MRILNVIPSYFPAVRYGGPVETSKCLAEALATLGHDVRVVTTDSNGPWEVVDTDQARSEDPSEGPEVRRCARQCPPDVSADLVRETVEGTDWADLVHVTGVYSFSTIPALAAARALRKPCVWSPHGSLQSAERRATRELKAAWRAVTRFVLPAQTVLHWTSEDEARRSSGRYPSVPTVIVPNGVAVPPARTQRLARGGLEVLFLGRIHPIKRLDVLLDAVALARGEGLDVRLSVAGGGSAGLLQALQAQARGRGIAGSVRWCGDVRGNERELRFAEADVLALVSDSENFGMVAAEALARRLPVIASWGTPWSSLLTRRCGFWVDCTPRAIAAAFAAAVAADLEGMGSRGRDWMIEQFSWIGRAQEMVALYEGLISARARRKTGAPRKGSV